MVKIEKSETFIYVYFNEKLVLEIVDMEFGIEVYDYRNDSYLPVTSPCLNGAFEEIQPYLDKLLKEL